MSPEVVGRLTLYQLRLLFSSEKEIGGPRRISISEWRAEMAAKGYKLPPPKISRYDRVGPRSRQSSKKTPTP